MGYDLFIHRNVFVDRSNLGSLPHLKCDSKRVVISELLLDISGWEVSKVVQRYITNDKQELPTDELIDLYKECCEVNDEEVDQDIINILETDHQDKENIIFYELTQSY